ncbi:AAA family ATPase [Candidatus Woesearchaeota archaeon]|nr:AAA family ATPase [Candidatus Woesearchaeota archaeon]
MEALQEEAYKGIVRVDTQTMRSLDIRPGDIIEIEGGRKTVGIADRAYPSDIGQDIIRMDGILRRNAKTGIGEYIVVRKADVKEAKHLTIAPAQQGVMIQADPSIFKRGLFGRAVVKGDIVALGGARRRQKSFSGSPFEEIFNVFEEGYLGTFGLSGLKFIVADTNPKQPVIITENTAIKVSSKAIEVSEERVPDVTYEDIGGLDEELKKIREMVELPLKHPELFERLGIEPPKGVLLHGPPGTGKTLLAKAVANECEANFILVNGPELTCVSGETELLTNPNGREKIENLFNEAYKNSEIVVKNDEKEIIVPKAPIKVFSLNENFEIVPDTIKSLTRVKKDQTLRVQTKKGTDLQVSRSHPFAILDSEGNLKWIPAKDLKVGSYVATASNIKPNKENPEVEWWKNLDQENTFVKIGNKEKKLKDIKNIREITGIKHATLKSNIARAKFIKPIFGITPKFAEFIGLMYSEGYIGFDEVSVTGEDSKLLDYYKLFFKEIFGFEDSRITIKYGRQGKTTVYSTILAEMLTKGFGLPRHKKPKDAKLPNWLFKCNKETIAGFIRGYYYGDGCQGWIKQKYPTPAIYSANKEFVKDIQILLLYLGIISKISLYKTGMGNLLYTLRVLDREGKEKFFNLLKLEFKKEVFDRWLESRIKDGSCELIPNISSLLYKLKTYIGLKYNKDIPEVNFEPIISGRFPLTFRNAKRLVSIFEENFQKKKTLLSKQKVKKISEHLKKLKRIAYSDLKWDRITKIEQKGPKLLYDLSMSKYSNFFAGSPLVLLHNSRYYGDSEKRIRDIFEEAEKNAPSIIFFDEIDSVAPKREETYGEVERRMVAQLLATMDGMKSRGRVIVIGATNRPNSIDPALRRPGRFDREIQIGVPNKEGRLNVLKIHSRNMPLAKDVKLDEFASITHGFVGADLQALCKESAMCVLRKALPGLKLKDEKLSEEFLSKLVVTKKDFQDALKIVRPSALREVLIESPNIHWDEIGGLDEIKQELAEAVEWPLKNPQVFERLGIRPTRGILLYGPPGTGKTLVAKAVATESESNFISVKGPELISMWVGESLPYNEELIVKENGIVKRMKIGDIVEKRLDIEVMAFDKDKRIRFTKIDDFIKHKLTGNLLEVTTRTGRKIKVTDYHSLFSFVNGKLTDIPASHLIPGESYIAIPRNLNLPRENIKQINLYEHFKNDKGVFVSGIKEYLKRALKVLDVDKTAGILKISKKYLADILSKNLPIEIVTFDTLIKEAKLAIDFNEIRIKLKGSIHDYPTIFKVNKDLWRLIGIWVAEGDFNGHTIRIHNQNKEIREDIRRICAKHGFSTSEMETCITINSLFLQKTFKKVFGLVEGSENKRLPPLAYILDKESKANLLRGYFSGDGSIWPTEGGKFHIEAGTVSKELANDLMYLLLDFGIVATQYEKSERTGSTTHRISLLGIKKFERFIDIGFIDKERNDRIQKYIDSRGWARSDLIPLSGELYELASGHNKTYSANESIGKEYLKQILIYADRDKTKYKEYWDLVEGDIFFDLVKEIKILPPEKYVYDISVPGDQNFVAGFGGILAHNSEKGVRKIFEKARQAAPCIIFFDEIDAIASKRGIDAGSRATERVVNQLLTEMDGLQDLHDVVVIAATNRPDMLDAALLRPGRFDKIIYTPIPDKKARLNIFRIHTKDMPLAPDVHHEELAKLAEGCVGADIEAICREAGLIALREDINAKQVSMKHFKKALERTKPSLREEDVKRYREIEEAWIKSAKQGNVQQPPSYLG